MQAIYKRLNQGDRILIEGYLKIGKTRTEIAELLGRSYSSIYREIQRCKEGKFRWKVALGDAIKKSSSRRFDKTKIFGSDRLKEYIYDNLKRRWSPEQISLNLPIEYPNDPEMRITFESIYYHIYMHLDLAKREALIERLRQSRRARGNANRGKNRSPTIPERVMIDERPEGANSRQEAGHWEGDLVLGKNRESAIGTIVERKTRHLIIVPLKKRDATSVRIAFEKEFRKIPLKMRKSMTYDNGSEMAQHKLLSKNTKMKIYFAHPYSPWERPTNENFNGLIRDYFPKGTDFNTISPKELKYVQNELNERPRKILNMNTPKAVFQSLISTMS